MIKIQIDGIAALQKKLEAAGKQAKFAAARALTKTGQAVEKRLQSDMGTAFDNPSPWISKRGTFLKAATKADLTATVGIVERQNLYVKEHFLAGQRNQKPYEKALAGMGILPAGFKVVPGSGLKLDARGIPNRGQLKEIFGALASRMQVAKGRGKRMQLHGYFVIHPSDKQRRLAPGVWWRAGRATKPVLLFIRTASYQKRLDLHKSAQAVVDQEFERLFAESLDLAMGTAR